MEKTVTKIPSWLVLIVYGFSAITIFPVLWWLVQSTRAEDQLSSAFFMIVLTGVFLYLDQRLTLRLRMDFSGVCQGTLLGSYVFLGLVSFVTLHPFLEIGLLLLGVSLLFFSFFHYLFGEENRYFLNSLVVAFAGFIGFAFFQPILDVPLRFYAGLFSGKVLGAMGLENEFYLVQQETVQLILKVEGNNYLVAPECNGFGVISSSILIGLLLSFYYHIAVWKRVGFVLLTALWGFIFNTIRIVFIIILAPHFPGHYDLMHEIVGTISFLTAIATILYGSTKIFKKKPATNSLVTGDHKPSQI